MEHANGYFQNGWIENLAYLAKENAKPSDTFFVEG
jgi:hypothetical protein